MSELVENVRTSPEWAAFAAALASFVAYAIPIVLAHFSKGIVFLAPVSRLAEAWIDAATANTEATTVAAMKGGIDRKLTASERFKAERVAYAFAEALAKKHGASLAPLGYSRVADMIAESVAKMRLQAKKAEE